MVGKIGQGIIQLLLFFVAAILNFTFIGMVIGIPLGLAVWIWGLVSVVSAPPAPVHVVVTHINESKSTVVTANVAADKQQQQDHPSATPAAANLPPAAPPRPDNAAIQKGSSNKAVLGGVIAAVLLATAGGGGYWYYQKQEAEKVIAAEKQREEQAKIRAEARAEARAEIARAETQRNQERVRAATPATNIVQTCLPFSNDAVRQCMMTEKAVIITTEQLTYAGEFMFCFVYPENSPFHFEQIGGNTFKMWSTGGAFPIQYKMIRTETLVNGKCPDRF